MIKVGQLFKTKQEDTLTGNTELCEIVHTYNKADIDPECPESVAIIGMVKAVWVSGHHIGKTFTSSRRNFSKSWEVISDT